MPYLRHMSLESFNIPSIKYLIKIQHRITYTPRSGFDKLKLLVEYYKNGYLSATVEIRLHLASG